MKQISLHHLFFLLIALVIQQTTISAMDCPECNRHFSRSINLINHYNKNHTNKEFYLYAQDKDYIPKKSSKKNTQSHSKNRVLVKKANNPLTLKQQPEQGLQERLKQRFLLEIIQDDYKPNNSVFFPEFSAYSANYLEPSDSYTSGHNLELPDFSTSAHNTDYLEWTEK